MTFEEELKYRLSIRSEALKNTGVDEKDTQKLTLSELLAKLGINK